MRHAPGDPSPPGKRLVRTNERWLVAVLAIPIFGFLILMLMGAVTLFMSGFIDAATDTEHHGYRLVWLAGPIVAQYGLVLLFRSSVGGLPEGARRWIDRLDVLEKEVSARESGRRKMKPADAVLLGINAITHLPVAVIGLFALFFPDGGPIAVVFLGPPLLQLALLAAIYATGVRWLYYLVGVGLTTANVALWTLLFLSWDLLDAIAHGLSGV